MKLFRKILSCSIITIIIIYVVLVIYIKFFFKINLNHCELISEERVLEIVAGEYDKVNIDIKEAYAEKYQISKDRLNYLIVPKNISMKNYYNTQDIYPSIYKHLFLLNDGSFAACGSWK